MSRRCPLNRGFTVFGSLRLLCTFSRSTSAYAAISQPALPNKACVYVCMFLPLMHILLDNILKIYLNILGQVTLVRRTTRDDGLLLESHSTRYLCHRSVPLLNKRLIRNTTISRKATKLTHKVHLVVFKGGLQENS